MRIRIAAAFFTAVVLGGSLGAGVAGAAPYDRGTARACPGDVPDAFDDDEASVHEANVNCIAHWRITQGVGPRLYGPAAGTRRDQMATFVVNLMTSAGYGFPTSPPDAFDDDGDSVHEESANKLAAAGVVAGKADGGYHPAELVRRDQMATYIAQAIEAVAGVTLLNGEDYFTDDGDSVHEERINDIAAAGIVQGTGDGAYAPGHRVRRDQMASFIAKAADYLASLGYWPAFGTNQAFRVTPWQAAIMTVSTSSTDDTGARAYVAQVGNVAEVDVALIPCNEVLVGSSDVVTFGDDEGAGRAADDLGSTDAVIELINGSAASGDHVDAAEAVNEAVSFQVDSTTVDVCVRPVVFRDANDNNQLDLDGTRRPTESFGVGGEVRWVPPEAAAGSFNVADVSTVVKDHDLFTGDAGLGLRTFFYDTNDTFRIGGVSATLSQFEAALSAYDAVSGTYADDPADKSTFDLTDSDPATPTGVTALAEGSTVTVSWTASSTPAVDAYRVYRAATGSDCDAEGSYSQVSEVAGTKLEVSDTGLASGSYCYKVRAVDDGDQSVDSAEALVTVDTAGPVITDVRAQEGAGSTNGVLDAGDFVQVIFSEPMASTVDDAGAALTLSTGTLTCGTNASCVLQPAGTYNGGTYEAGRVLRIKVAGAAGGGSYPLTVTGVSTHWDDLAGNALSLSSGDTTLDVAAMDPSAEATGPDMMGVAVDAPTDVVTLTYNEPVVCDATAASQFTYQDENTASVTATGVTCDGTGTVALTFPGDIVNGSETGTGSVTYTDDDGAAVDTNDVRDLNGNQAQPTETQMFGF